MRPDIEPGSLFLLNFWHKSRVPKGNDSANYQMLLDNIPQGLIENFEIEGLEEPDTKIERFVKNAKPRPEELFQLRAAHCHELIGSMDPEISSSDQEFADSLAQRFGDQVFSTREPWEEMKIVEVTEAMSHLVAYYLSHTHDLERNRTGEVEVSIFQLLRTFKPNPFEKTAEEMAKSYDLWTKATRNFRKNTPPPECVPERKRVGPGDNEAKTVRQNRTTS